MRKIVLFFVFVIFSLAAFASNPEWLCDVYFYSQGRVIKEFKNIDRDRVVYNKNAGDSITVCGDVRCDNSTTWHGEFMVVEKSRP